MTRITSQTAMQGLQVLNSAKEVRLSASGRVRAATSLDLAVSSFLNLFSTQRSAASWASKAKESIQNKLFDETSLFKNGMSDKERQKLAQIFNNITSHINRQSKEQWRTQLSESISTLRSEDEFGQLAAALETINNLNISPNTSLYPFVRASLLKNPTLSHQQALKDGLVNYLVKKKGIAPDTANNAAPKMLWAMKHCRVDVKEAFDIAVLGGRLAKNQRATLGKAPVLEMAYLIRHHDIELSLAMQIRSEVNACGKKLTEALELPAVMLAYQVAADGADAMHAHALELVKVKDLTESSMRCRLDIAYLRMYMDKNLNQACAIQTLAEDVREQVQLPVKDLFEQTAARLAQLRTEEQLKIAAALPRGWDAAERLGNEACRKLTVSDKGQQNFVKFLQDSAQELGSVRVDTTTGLADNFISDANRTHIAFCSGTQTKKFHQGQGAQVIKGLQEFAGDPAIALTLSKLLYQSGGNGIRGCLTHEFAQTSEGFFSILPLDQFKDNNKATSHYTMVVTRAANDKIAITYTLYEKHFTLMNVDTNQSWPINGEHDSSKPTTPEDYTARTVIAVQFSKSDLMQGIIQPQIISPPEVELKIEIDRDKLDVNLVQL